MSGAPRVDEVVVCSRGELRDGSPGPEARARWFGTDPVDEEVWIHPVECSVLPVLRERFEWLSDQQPGIAVFLCAAEEASLAAHPEGG